MEEELSPNGLSPEHTCIEPGLPPRMPAPNLRLNNTMEPISRVLSAGEQDLALSAQSKQN